MSAVAAKRNGGFDFTYRLPFVRNWLSLYVDSMSPDDPSPLDAPRRPAANPGIYLSHFPHLPWLDLRFEAVYTETPARDPFSNGLGGQYIYWEAFYHDLYTNQGNIIGSWIGREGKGIQAWSTYWLSPRSTIQVSYRGAHVAKDFLEGGTYQDFGARADLLIRPQLSLASSLQYEQWDFPLLFPTRNSNFKTSLQLTYWPSWKIHP